MSRFRLVFSRTDFFVPSKVEVLRGYCDEWLLFMEYKQLPYISTAETDCLHTWIQKADLLLNNDKIDIQKLTLAFTDAYSPDGTFLGEQIAEFCCTSVNTPKYPSLWFMGQMRSKRQPSAN